jgi:DNA processing protein
MPLIDVVALAMAVQTQPALASRLLVDAGYRSGEWSLQEALAAARVPAADPARLRQQASALVDDARATHDVPLALCAGGYPAGLTSIADPPLLLWVRGDVEVLSAPAVAIVGSRAARPAAVEVAHALGMDLARCGLTVVSGFARGVDAAAHGGALQTGRTIAVLGTGLGVRYPRHQTDLAGAIAARGALVTEFLPGAPPQAHHFPLRNRILSALSLGVVVVEASDRSGSLITARLALEQHRPVMVVPGDIRGGANRGGHALLRDGARLVECAADVLDELGLTAAPPANLAAPGALEAASAVPPLLHAILAGQGQTLDELAARFDRSAPALLRDLLDFELAGLVTRDAVGRYVPLERKW